MLESKIEKEVCDFAKTKGWLVYKFKSPSNRGVPDKIFMKLGTVIFIEFKATDKKPRKLQTKIMKRITDQGIDCYVIDDIEDGKALFSII